MLWMENYLLYCSVRLGVMVISSLTLISNFVLSMLFFVMGLDLLNPILKLFNEDDHFRKHFMVKKMSDLVDNESSKLLVILQLYLFSHMAASILAFYGTWKIKKYYLIPLAIFEFFRVIYCLAVHILLMTVFKNKFNLGVLISATLGGGFFILYLGYNWATIVALYQVITLINSERYKAIYGDDPFQPLIPKTYNPLITPNVRVLITPQSRDVDDQKRRNMVNGLISTTHVLTQPAQSVISVIPASYAPLQNGQQNRNKRKWKWKNSQWPIDLNQRHERQEAQPSMANQMAAQNDYNQSVNYNYWQWAELAPAISARNRPNIYTAANWRY